jgi:carboxyl-terminal processing protease
MRSFVRTAVLAPVVMLVTTHLGNAAAPAGRALVPSGVGAVSDTGSRLAVDSTLAVATFDSVWHTVGTSLEDRGVTRVDWMAVRRELRPQAAQAATDSVLRGVITDMLGRIGESHFALLPAQPALPAADGSTVDASLGSAGLTLRVVDGRVVVWRVDSAGAARRAGVAPGWIIDRVDDYRVPALGADDTAPAERLSAIVATMHALRGPPGRTVRVVAHDGGGVERVVLFARDSLRGPIVRFGNLPPLAASFDASRRTLPDGRCIGVIHFEYWLPPVMPALDRVVQSNRACAGIVLDLRGNPGGVAAMMIGVAGHFLNEPLTLGIMRTRGDEMRFVANPRRSTEAGLTVQPYSGPLAILVDGMSASTSEMFSASLQALGRARIFGERTSGQALPAIATRLPNGDVLMHVIADFVAADGSRVEGRGVVPDETVPLTRADLSAGRDAAIDAAVRWIERTRQPAP